jgi:hypothetical protein
MQYKVVPFTANVTRNENSSAVASQLQGIIENHLSEGWEYQRMESVETFVAPTSGCFGFGAQSGYSTAVQMLVFKRV